MARLGRFVPILHPAIWGRERRSRRGDRSVTGEASPTHYARCMEDPELDPFSPAGTVERFGEFSRGLSRRRWGKAAVWIVLSLFFLVPAVSYLVVFLVHHH
jgi:hypothetical protein